MMKKQTFEYSEQQSLEVCIRQLEALLEGLKAGTVSLNQNQQKLWLRPGSAVELELYAEQSGESERLEVRLGWRRRNLHVIPTVGGDEPPKTVRNWHEMQSRRDGSLDEQEACAA